MDIKDLVTAARPVCELCFHVMRKPCRLAWKDGSDLKHLVVCAGCYRIAMCLARMVEHGFIASVDQ